MFLKGWRLSSPMYAVCSASHTINRVRARYAFLFQTLIRRLWRLTVGVGLVLRNEVSCSSKARHTETTLQGGGGVKKGWDTCCDFTRQLYQICKCGFTEYLWVMSRAVLHKYFSTDDSITLILKLLLMSKFIFKWELISETQCVMCKWVILLSWSTPMTLQVLATILDYIKANWLLARRLWFMAATADYFICQLICQLFFSINRFVVWSIKCQKIVKMLISVSQSQKPENINSIVR